MAHTKFTFTFPTGVVGRRVTFNADTYDDPQAGRPSPGETDLQEPQKAFVDPWVVVFSDATSLTATTSDAAGNTITATATTGSPVAAGPASGAPPSPGSQPSSGLVLAPDWQPNTAYKAKQLVWQAGQLYRAKTAFTSSGAFNTANWDAAGSAAYVAAVLPEAYGAKGDGTTDDSAAFQAAINAARTAAVAAGSQAKARVIASTKNYRVTGLTNAGQVVIDAWGATFKAAGSGPMFTFTGTFGGLVGNGFLDGGGSGVGANGVVMASGSKWNRLDATFDSFSGRAVYCAPGSIANDIRTQLVTNCLLSSPGSLADYTGAVELDGTDHYFWNSEVSVSRASLSSGSMFADGVVLRGANHMIDNVVAETSDIGWVINSTDLRMVNCRGDLNRGHGWLFVAGSGSIVGCEALNNSQETDNTYDGFQYLSGQFSHSACLAVTTVANRHHFGFNDTQNSLTVFNTFDAACRSTGQGANAFQTTAFAPGHFAQTNNPPYRVNVNATTFNVTPGWVVKNIAFQNTSAVSFTNFTSGLAGQELIVWGDGFTTLVHGSGINLRGAQNLLLAANQCIRLVMNNGTWYQTDLTAPVSLLVPPGAVAANATFTWGAQNMGGVRLLVPTPTLIRYIDWEVITAAGNIDIGIIALSGANHLTWTLVAHSGAIACPAAGAIRTDLGAQILPPGDYAVALWGDSSSLQVRGQGGRSDLQSTRLSVLKTGIASGGIPASGTLSQFWSSGFAFTVEADL